MKKSIAHITIKTRIAAKPWWIFAALIVFFVISFQEAQAQPCPTVNAPSFVNVCSGNPASIALKSDITGTEFSWIVTQTGVIGAAAGTGSSISCVLTSVDAGAGSAVYTVTPTANGCKGKPAVVTINVNPKPNISALPLTSTITSGNTATIKLTGDEAETLFSWTVIRSGVTGAASGSGSLISQTLTTASDSGIVTYHITSNVKGCAGLPITAKVKVMKKP